ncbi:PREDICTED: DNA ligase 4 [Nicrophorus vespilloides]|uniref:DNA ligase 4 n=1 Tax=Nicrophorus vespilloides TaxID=110193 RepID=A0ABM1LZP7_NICVS|nr:PREDICTED: DNA ligase 4 [Nicrophorus vespilloides]
MSKGCIAVAPIGDNIATLNSFNDFCRACEGIKNSPDIVGKTTILHEYMQSVKSKAKLCNRDVDKSLFPIIRLLLPQYERHRNPYQLQESTFIKVLINKLSLTAEEATLLKKYKDIHTARKAGDFADVASEMLSKRFFDKGSMSIYELNSYLDNISFYSTNKSIQEDTILSVISATTPLEQKWFIRIIFKDLKLGLGYNKILTSLHWTAPKLFNRLSSLEKICTILSAENPIEGDIAVQLFSCVRPMLSKRCCKDIFSKLFGREHVYFMETKYDGERFQIHYNHNVVKLFSRNGFDFTSKFQELVDVLPSLIKSNARNFIIDGEMMLWNKAEKKFASKGYRVDVKNLKPEDEYQACFVSFDLIFWNGYPAIDKPLFERKIFLENMIENKEGVYLYCDYSVAKKKAHVINFMNEAMNNAQEGIVMKRHDSKYLPNERTGWYKLKPDYFDGLVTDLDLVVMGGNYSDLRSEAYCSMQVVHFVCGVFNDESRKVTAFCRISAGLSQKDLELINEKLGPYFNDDFEDPEFRHSNLEFGIVRPDVWIDPRVSCVFVARGTELTLVKAGHPHCKTDYTLRFPRVMSIRFDKIYTSCLTVFDLMCMTDSCLPVIKTTKQQLYLEDINQPFKKNTRLQTQIYSEILQGLEFLIYNGGVDKYRLDMEHLIVQHSGRVVEVEGPTTFCIIVGDPLNWKKYENDSETDVVKMEWLLRIVALGRYAPFDPEEILYASPITRRSYKCFYDETGDSFTEPVKIKSLETFILRSDHMRLNAMEIAQLRAEINPPVRTDKYTGIIAYFDKYAVFNVPESNVSAFYTAMEADFLFHGGRICKLTEHTKYIIADTQDDSRVRAIDYFLSDNRNETALMFHTHDELLKHIREETAKARAKVLTE